MLRDRLLMAVAPRVALTLAACASNPLQMTADWNHEHLSPDSCRLNRASTQSGAIDADLGSTACADVYTARKVGYTGQ